MTDTDTNDDCPKGGKHLHVNGICMDCGDRANADGRRLVVTRGSQVKVKKLIWWEFGLVLQYAINLLAAREGKGKSTVASSWAARETRNGGVVLWIGTEESRESAIVPRLIAAGADMDRVIFVDVQTDLGTGALVFPLDLVRIEGVIREHDVTMLFLDPAKAVVPSGFSGRAMIRTCGSREDAPSRMMIFDETGF